MSKHIAIIGAGAIGGYFGARLADIERGRLQPSPPLAKKVLAEL